MDRKQVESIAKSSGLRYNKNTLCTAITDIRILAFIEKNGLLPYGFILSGESRKYGYNQVRNRILAMPLYTYNRIVEEFNKIYPSSSVSGDENLGQIEVKLGGLKAIEEVLKQNMLIIFLSNFTPQTKAFKELAKFNIIIEDLDVMGTIEGRLVPKTGNLDENGGRNLND